MNPSARPQTSRNRDRALARLQSITTQTAIAASIATVGFGGLAAFTYSGTTDSTNAVDTNGQAGSVDGTSTDSTSGTGATSTDTTGAGLQPTAAPAATAKHKARVTSGGSGH
jgi:hypothetical protein